MRRTRLRQRALLGFTLVEVAAVAALCTSIPAGTYAKARSKGSDAAVISNLRQIGQRLQMYINDHGHYPKAAFYPENPQEDGDSIRKMLDPKGSRGTPSIGGMLGRGGGGGDKSIWVNPALPEKLQEKGLNYVYNADLAGRKGVSNPSKTWVLFCMTAVVDSDKVPMPHTGGRAVLFADGSVKITKQLPRKLKKLQQD